MTFWAILIAIAFKVKLTRLLWETLRLLFISTSVANLIKPIVNYDSRVVIWGIFKSGTTLES